MRTTNEIEVVLMQKLGDYVLPERERDTPVIFAPSVDLFIRVGPEKVAEKSGVWNICGPHNTLDLVQARQLWAETAMHTKDLFINDSSARKAVETVSEGLPELDAEAPLAFIIETIDPVDGSTFVISTQDKEVFRILDFVCQKQADCLQALLATVDIVAEENVVRFRREAPVFK
jgi:hypothetical protein